MHANTTLRVWRELFEDTESSHFDKAIWSRLKSTKSNYCGLGADILERAVGIATAERVERESIEREARDHNQLLIDIKRVERVEEKRISKEKWLKTPDGLAHIAKDKEIKEQKSKALRQQFQDTQKKIKEAEEKRREEQRERERKQKERVSSPEYREELRVRIDIEKKENIRKSQEIKSFQNKGSQDFTP